MTTDLILAILHHVAVFGLVATLFGEALLLRRGIGPADIPLISRLDTRYGIVAGVVLGVGAARVVWGAKGWAYYQDNPWFWAKMACFAAVAIISIGPTMRFVRWRLRQRADPAYAPDEGEVRAVRRMVGLQALLVFLILAFAATMARFA
jgi:putative membrane protein